VLVVGVRPERVIRDRVEQRLHREIVGDRPRVGGTRRVVLLADTQRGRGRERAARARPGDPDPRRVAAQRPAVGRHPGQRGVGVVDRRGKWVFGGEAVVHADDRTAGAVGEFPADTARRVQRPRHPPAAVVEDQDRQRAIRCR
jgi:hypothetical protein